MPYTDFITGTEGEEGLSGPVDLPAGADQPDQVENDDPGNNISPVVAEFDNFLVDQSLEECTKDRVDYCDTEAVSDYKGPDHTMCKFCVSLSLVFI